MLWRHILKLKRILTGAATLTLILCVAVSIFSIFIFAANEDYSNPVATGRVTLDSADVLEMATGISLSDAERNYLSRFGTESITYGERVSSTYVTYSYDSSSESLYVEAQVYEYTTASGFKMVWTPVSVSVGERSEMLTFAREGVYSATVSGVSEDGKEYFDVLYSSSVAISSNTLTSLASKAYNDVAPWSEYADYIVKKAEYDANLALYNKYVADKNVYDEKHAAYQQYLKELADYEAAMLLYEKYEAALAEYNAKYAEYSKYLEEEAKYQQNLEKYQQYVQKIDTVRHQISIIDGIKKHSTSLVRSLYGAIITDTVTQVLENKDAIANELTGVDGAVIDLAGESTENLRALFAEYFAIEGEEEKYVYYTLNYENFRDSFTNLFKTLDYLYGNAKVRLALRQQGKIVKYEILLAQLYYTVMALNDEPVQNYEGNANYDSSYKINGKTPLAVNEGEVYIADLDKAEPISGGYPTVVTKPVIGEKVDEPQKPTPVLMPIAPKEVENPGDEPVVVTRPTPVEICEPPVKLEDPYSLPEEVGALLSAYDRGEITARGEYTQNARIPLEIYATKKFLDVDELLLVFHGTDGEQLLRTNAERGSYVEFVGSIPTKPSDLSADYTFVGWQDSSGNEIDMSRVDAEGGELDLYPLFRAEYKLYPVTWYSDGKKIATTYERYGAVPQCPVIPERADNGSFMYSFVGWKEELTPVSESAASNVYNAKFSPEFIVPYSNGSGADVSFDYESGVFTVDASYSPDKELDLSNLIPRVAQKGELVIKSRSYTLKFTYSEVIALAESGVQRISVFSAQKGLAGYSFAVNLYTGEGVAPDEELTATVTFPFVFADKANMRLYFDTEEGRELVHVSPADDSLTTRLVCDRTYNAVTEYAIDVMSSDAVYLSVDKVTATAGERVQVSFAAPTGTVINSVYYVTRSGGRQQISSNEFIMPAEGVSVGIDFSYVEYTVKFVSDGRVISSRTYKYGEEPILPAEPKKAQDGSYSYRFLDWEPIVAPVTEDATYEALFQPTPLPEKDAPDGLIISDGVLRTIFKLVMLFVLAAIFIPALVIVTVKTVRRLGRRAKSTINGAKK